MNRRIFIIKGYSKTEEELNLDRHYSENYKNYFNSIAGGAFEENEIIYIEEATVEDLNIFLLDFELDYTIFVLIGHGATQNDKQLFQLNENEIIKPGQITIPSSKCLVLLESCRSEVKNIMTVDLNDKIPKYQYGGYVRSPITREKSRELYDEHLSKCDEGIVICFACSNNETARNFYFSLVLLQVSFNWHLEYWHHYEILSIGKLMPSISKDVNKLAKDNFGENQIPEINGNIDFPFSVSKF